MAKPLDPMTVAPVSTRLPVEAAATLRAMAAEQGISLSVLMREMLLDQLNLVRPERDQMELELTHKETSAA